MCAVFHHALYTELNGSQLDSFPAYFAWGSEAAFNRVGRIRTLSFLDLDSVSPVWVLLVSLLWLDSLQTWCIPGTFFFNLLAGSLFGVKLGFVYCVMANSCGALTCFLLSRLFGKKVLEFELIKTQAEWMRRVTEEHKDNLFFYLTFLRLFPGSPNWVMNITFPHIGISAK